jgi:hypothetical protein
MLMVEKNGSRITVTNTRQKDRESGDKLTFSLVAETMGPSAYLVASVDDGRFDPTHGAAAKPAEPAYDASTVLPTGVEDYHGRGKAIMQPLAQVLAQHGQRDVSKGFTLVEVTKRLGRKSSDTSTWDAWNALWSLGALTGASAAGRCWWVEPGDERGAELTRRIVSS